MTRKEFDDGLYRTLVSMGDPSYRHNDPEWDVEYERMKKLPFKTFEKLCGAGVIMYNKSNDALNN